ncbi:PQQ-binding-like beta-propeller repeat protein [Adhaeribacter pallidiroseus]|uniref:Uncharacterized protein n=1 Tax=Adhaeribacter pallidiroseus TaxID=2072847 RepID=A0A369QR41_9BACT|nr:hypothetical protein [Adhaeribacter pallidiroseus]RDC65299.1 hypothetical protein AHMF7616_03929 [Adhaeribacter pallidiroseus]
MLTDGCYGKNAIKDYWIIKIDANGKKLWDKTFGGDQEEILTSLIATRDGGYLLGGISQSGKSGDKSEPALANGDYDYWLVKIDAAGNKVWDKTLGTTNADFLTSLIAAPDGGYLLGDNNFSVTKIDATGKLTWKKSFLSATNSFSPNLKALLLTSDGNYLLGGGSYIKTNYNYRVLKLDTNGDLVWDKSYGGASSDQLEALVAAPDGGYLLGGTSNSTATGDKTDNPRGTAGQSDYWILKIDSNGTKEWDQTLGGAQADELADLISTPDGGYLLGGTSTSSNNAFNMYEKSEPLRGYRDYWVVKVDGQGKKEWDKTAGSYLPDLLSTIIVDAKGDYLLGGTSYSDIGGDKSEARKGLQDYWVIKLQDKTPLVTTTWDMRYGGYGTDNLSSLIQTADGGYLSGGYTNSGATGDKSQPSQGKNDYWIVKSDKKGQKEWDKRYGGYSDDYLNQVLQTPDGGYLLAGSSYSQQSGDKSQASRGDRDYWIVKTDKWGQKEWDQRYGGTGKMNSRK